MTAPDCLSGLDGFDSRILRHNGAWDCWGGRLLCKQESDGFDSHMLHHFFDTCISDNTLNFEFRDVSFDAEVHVH